MVKLSRSRYQPLFMLGLMGVAGVATVSIHQIALIIGLWLLGYGWLQTLRKRNRDGEAHLYAAMIVGAEVYFKMAFAGLPWEFAKISVIILLLTGMLVERAKRPFPLLILVYGLLLIPGIFIPDWQSMEQFKHDLMMNLSGEVTLIVSVIYFYKRKIAMPSFVQMMRMLIYGVTLMAVMVYVKTPDYATIHYGHGSNFEASGGFGPNQVAAMFGVGVFVFGIMLLQDVRVFLYKWIDTLLLVLFALQGLFTLSRGGLISSAIALAFTVIVLYLFSPKQVLGVLRVNPVKLAVIGLVMTGAFMAADSILGGAVFERYFNVDKYGEQIKEDYSTHRIDVAKTDLKTFEENWETGVGVGGSATFREQNIGFGATHVEFSRLLADHGILGAIALLIMFGFPIGIFFKNGDARSRMILVGFVSLSLLTMSHNAMRLAMPGFFYGLGFILLYYDQVVEQCKKR